MISREHFVKLAESEHEAYLFYDALARRLKHPDFRKAIERIRDDERGHEQMAKRLLELAEKLF